VFYTDGKLQYHVRVDEPNPLFAKMLQQAIGGIEGEIRVALQYLFQAWGARGPKRYRDMILETGTEELAHIEMLSTAVALNLQGASDAVQEGVAAKDPATAAILGGMSPRHVLSSALNAMPVNSEGVPFDCSHVYATGNLAADMYANVTAEAGGRALATRLYALTDDPGMKDMLSFLIARDTMHQQQWLAVLEELGGSEALPIPDSFPQEQERGEFSYRFLAPVTSDGPPPAEGRWSTGPSIDGRGEFAAEVARPHGAEPQLPPPIPQGFAQRAQMEGARDGGSPHLGGSKPPQQEGLVDKVRDRLS
jgi:Mn-containing catalase